MSHRVVVPAGMLLLGTVLCCAQTFEVAPQNDASRTSGATRSPRARAAAPNAENTLGWGSGLEVAQQARAAQAALVAGDYVAASSHAELAAKGDGNGIDCAHHYHYFTRGGPPYLAT